MKRMKLKLIGLAFLIGLTPLSQESAEPPFPEVIPVVRASDQIVWDGSADKYAIQVSGYPMPFYTTTNRIFAGILFHGKTNGVYVVEIRAAQESKEQLTEATTLTLRWNGKIMAPKRARVEPSK